MAFKAEFLLSVESLKPETFVSGKICMPDNLGISSFRIIIINYNNNKLQLLLTEYLLCARPYSNPLYLLHSVALRCETGAALTAL